METLLACDWLLVQPFKIHRQHSKALHSTQQTTLQEVKEFSEFIRAHKVEEGEIMVSFDVEALYTNVTNEDALIIKELLENDETLSDRTPL